MMKAVIFDLDGTLSNSLESIAYSANLALQSLGMKTYETECYKRFVGDGASELVKSGLAYPCFCTAHELSALRDEQEQQGVDHQREHIHKADSSVGFKQLRWNRSSFLGCTKK